MLIWYIVIYFCFACTSKVLYIYKKKTFFIKFDLSVIAETILFSDYNKKCNYQDI